MKKIVDEFFALLKWEVDDKAVRDLEKRVEHAGKRISDVGQKIMGAGVVFSGALTAPIIGIGVEAAKSFGEMQNLQASFEVLLKSSDKAKERVKELGDFADLTPFELPEVARASKVLETLTRGTLSTGKGLTMVGDVASGTGMQFEDAAMWVGRLYDGIQSGRPVGEAVARLQEVGAISGTTRNKIEDLQKAGKKGGEVWKVAAADFARYSGTMAKQSDTLPGRWSTASGRFHLSLSRIGESFKPQFEAIIDLVGKAAEYLSKTADKINSLPQWQKNALFGFLLVLAAIGPILIALGGILAAVGAIATGLSAFTAIWGTIGIVMSGALAGVAVALSEVIIPILAIIFVVTVLISLFRLLVEHSGDWEKAAGKAFDKFAANVRKMVDGIKKIPGMIGNFFETMFLNVWNWIKKIADNPVFRGIVKAADLFRRKHPAASVSNGWTTGAMSSNTSSNRTVNATTGDIHVNVSQTNASPADIGNATKNAVNKGLIDVAAMNGAY